MSAESLNLRKLSLECDSEKYLTIGKNIIASDIGKAFSYLSLGLSLDFSKKEEYYKLYLHILEQWSSKLLDNFRYQDCLTLFDVAQEIYCNSADLNFLLAGVLFRIGKIREAWEYSLKTLKIYRNEPKVRGLVASLTNALVDRWHFPMINDKSRNKGFNLAIRKCIQDGHKSVLDIGCGSGLLSIYASQGGGSPVYACELDSFMCELAGNILKANDSDVHVLNCHSIFIGTQLPSRVSLVISEIFDAGLFGENILRILDHAWEELLLPPKTTTSPQSTNEKYGKVIPNSAEIYIALVECDSVRRQTKAELVLNGENHFEIVLDLDEPYLSEKMEAIPRTYKLLSNWNNVLDINFNSPTEIRDILECKVSKKLNFIVNKPGRLDGLILAFKLHLDEEHCIDTFPESNTCWENAIFPISLKKTCQTNDQYSFRMTYDQNLKFCLLETKEELAQCNESLQPSIVTLKTSDPQLIRCLNSRSFKSFFSHEAKKFSSPMTEASITVMDTCDYPYGGMTFLEINPLNKLYVTNANSFKLLTDMGIKVNSALGFDQKVDVVIYWPLTKEGMLKDNFTEELKFYRSLLREGGRIIPESIDIQMVGLESSRIASMTRINDENTFGVKVAEVFNIVMTQHHLDIPLDEISYKPMTPIITPVKINLNDLNSSFENFIESSAQSLIVGNKCLERKIKCTASSTGNIDGFAYWFDFNGTREGNLNTVNDDHQETLEKNSCASHGEALSPQSLVEEESILSTLSSDSPVNQCIIILDDAHSVTENKNLEINFAICDGQFSLQLEL